jgi:hypothetical protein
MRRGDSGVHTSSEIDCSKTENEAAWLLWNARAGRINRQRGERRGDISSGMSRDEHHRFTVIFDDDCGAALL